MIRQIPVTLPQSFEEALGYPGGFKWVAFYWEPCGDEAVYDDVVSSGDINWLGYQAFVDHPSVAPWLAPDDLGSSDSEAKHWLLCNLETREVYVGERTLVRSFLINEVKKYVPEAPNMERLVGIPPEKLKEIASSLSEGLKQMPTPSMQEIEERMRKDQEAVKNMVNELG